MEKEKGRCCCRRKAARKRTILTSHPQKKGQTVQDMEMQSKKKKKDNKKKTKMEALEVESDCATRDEKEVSVGNLGQQQRRVMDFHLNQSNPFVLLEKLSNVQHLFRHNRRQSEDEDEDEKEYEEENTEEDPEDVDCDDPRNVVSDVDEKQDQREEEEEEEEYESPSFIESTSVSIVGKPFTSGLDLLNYAEPDDDDEFEEEPEKEEPEKEEPEKEEPEKEEPEKEEPEKKEPEEEEGEYDSYDDDDDEEQEEECGDTRMVKVEKLRIISPAMETLLGKLKVKCFMRGCQTTFVDRSCVKTHLLHVCKHYSTHSANIEPLKPEKIIKLVSRRDSKSLYYKDEKQREKAIREVEAGNGRRRRGSVETSNRNYRQMVAVVQRPERPCPILQGSEAQKQLSIREMERIVSAAHVRGPRRLGIETRPEAQRCTTRNMKRGPVSANVHGPRPPVYMRGPLRAPTIQTTTSRVAAEKQRPSIRIRPPSRR